MNALTKRITLFVLAAFLLIYVGYQGIMYFFSSSIEFENVTSYTVYDRLEVEGIAIRSEQMLDNSSSGYVYYTLENGARVAKDGVIAQVYASENDAITKKNIEAVDAEIAALQTLQKQGSVSKSNIETINAQLSAAQKEMMEMTKSKDFSGASELKTRMVELLNRKQILAEKVNDFEARITALTEKREALAAGGYKDATGTISSPVAGYFVSSQDGYETMFDYAKVTSLTVDDVQKALDAKPKPNTACVGKVVGNYEWYIACVIPTEKLSQLAEKMNMNIILPFVADERIPVTVAKINKQGDRAMVLLKCSYMSEALSGVRCETIQILLNEYTGLYVPDEALRFDKNNQPGVFVRNGTTLQFRRVEIIYYSETGKYNICDPDVGTAQLEAGNDKKKPDKAETSDSGEETSDVDEPEESIPDESSSEETSTEVSSAEESTRDDVPYLKLFDDMVVGGKNLYEGKVIH